MAGTRNLLKSAVEKPRQKVLQLSNFKKAHKTRESFSKCFRAIITEIQNLNKKGAILARPKR